MIKKLIKVLNLDYEIKIPVEYISPFSQELLDLAEVLVKSESTKNILNKDKKLKTKLTKKV